MSDNGVRVNIYLSTEANERRKLIPNFSQWVDGVLIKTINPNGIMAQAPQNSQPEAPKNIQYFCVKCNTWVQMPRCPLCGLKAEKREAEELRI